MRLYFAGYTMLPDMFVRPDIVYLLESYLYFRSLDYHKWHREKNLTGKKMFLDSGAYSAMTLGVVINLQDYCEFIKLLKDEIEVYAGLDVIGDVVKTRENIEYMEGQGLMPLPTFHFKSPKEELVRMVAKYDYIALGGLVPIAMRVAVMRDWLDFCFSIIRDKCKVHGFGVNSYWAWERYPFFSVDATSWLCGGRYRWLVNFKNHELGKVTKTNALNRGIKTVQSLRSIEYGYRQMNENNLNEYIKAAGYVTRLWEKRGFRWD